MKINYKNKVYEYSKPIEAINFIKENDPDLKNKIVAVKINDVLKDSITQIGEDATLELILEDSKEAFSILNHSCAHLMAHAIKRLYPEAQFGVGPAIEEGFYYDFKINSDLSINDLEKIEKEMKKIAKEDIPVRRKEYKKEEVLALFQEDKFKKAIIEDLIEDDIYSVYEQKDFRDVCRGPHVISTKKIKNFKLLNVAGAYFKGDSKNEMLTRIYGVAFFSEEELINHLQILEERKKRDHRKLGKELELFMISDFGPGMPFWLPKGMTLKDTLIDFWKKIHKTAGYEFIQTPIMLNRELWETSGHWFNYKENMYISEIDDKEFAIKPMNCPGGMLVYKNQIRSYKEFPLRLAELGIVHRHEASGALSGLFRVREFTQDDAHIFMTKEQIRTEIKDIILLYKKVYDFFNLKFKIELSTRPEDKYIGSIEVWDESEQALMDACKAAGFDYKINPGDGAFYGPKLDFKLEDSMKRIWQCGTIQLDMNLPERFDLTYVSETGEKLRPVMAHRALFGSLERFIGIITEHFGGFFPTWLAPIQVHLIPVLEEKHKDFVLNIKSKLENNSFRTSTDFRDEKLGYKIREAQIKKIPYILVIGDKELENNTVTFRRHGEEDSTTVAVAEFIEILKQEVKIDL